MMGTECSLNGFPWRPIFLATLSIISIILFGASTTALALDDKPSAVDASVVFIDSLGGKFFRSRSDLHLNGDLDVRAAAAQRGRTEIEDAAAWSARTVSAATAVLLGVSPPVTIDSATAQKLDDLFRPDPFVKSQSIFSLLVSGASPPDLRSANGTAAAFSNVGINNFQWRNLVVDDVSVAQEGTRQDLGSHLLRLLSAIPKTAGEVIRVLHLGCHEAVNECGAKCMEEGLLSLAESVGGKYTQVLKEEEEEEEEVGRGVLTLNFPEGGFIELDMKKKADSQLLMDLVCLHRSINQLIKQRQDDDNSLTSSESSPELIIGTISASTELWTDSDSDSDSVRCANVGRFLYTSLAQDLKKYLLGYDGKASVQIAFLGENAGESMNVIQDLRRELKQGFRPDVFAATMLVRRAVAWITGIIVLIGVVLGLCCLCYMPTTRDSLLYSGAKLD